MMTNKIYDVITERMIKILENGTVPWIKPWTHSAPQNAISKKQYRGVNIWMLAGQEFKNPYWLTFKQCSGIDGSILKGEKGTPIIFYKMKQYKNSGKNDTDKNKTYNIPILRYSTVFNIEQTTLKDDIKFAPSTANNTEIIPAKEIINGYEHGPAFAHNNNGEAYYSPSRDYINVPDISTFCNSEAFYSVMFHEAIHSTGHLTRLNRFGKTDYNHTFGSKDYSKEELIAEMGAAFLCGICGIENNTIDRSAAYIDNWISKLKEDNTLLMKSAAAAQKAADHIRGIKEA